MSADAGLAFWLDYVDQQGGAFEHTGGATLVVLPPDLAGRHGHGEEFLVTAEPEVASEGTATLLSAGHPLLATAAQAVLTQGDRGRVRLARPAGRMPDGATLLEQLRGRFPVDHGRIDLTGGPRPAVRQVLRVGALVTFELSADDHFQEHVECWMDVSERLPLTPADTGPMVGLLDEMHSERDDLVIDSAAIPLAIAAADEEIRRLAERRQALLAQQVDESRAAELARAADYYREMVDSLMRRKSGASMGDPANQAKQAAYQARIEAAEAERDRRLAEIKEKYKGSVTILPFRLQVIGVPVLRLEVDARRGDRRYPMVIDWLAPSRSFAALRCPHCGSVSALVAGKARLGCRSCLPRAEAPPLALVTPPRSPRTLPPALLPKPSPTSPSPGTAGSGPGSALPPPAAKVPPPAKVKLTADDRGPVGLSATKIANLESKLVTRFWEQVAGGDPEVRLIVATGSPADVLLDLCGPRGLRLVVGLTDSMHIQQVQWSSAALRRGWDVPLPLRSRNSQVPLPLRSSEYRVTNGFLKGPNEHRHGFQMCWHIDRGKALVDEITHSVNAWWPRLSGALPPRLRAPGGLFDVLDPAPTWRAAAAPDRVADLLMRTTLRHRGLPLTVRCATSWRRIADRDELAHAHAPEVLAASLDRMISYRAGTARAQYLDVAADYRVGVAEMKAASAVLQRRLCLSDTQPW